MMKKGMKMPRKSREEYYIGVAREIAQRSPCARRKFGAVIVKDDTIVGTGYNGSARGTLNCGLDIPCLKNLSNEPHYTSYANCSGVHAEDNAVSATGWHNCKDGIMYLAGLEPGSGAMPCFQCRRKILNAQLVGVFYVDADEKIKYVSKEELRQLEIGWQNEKLKQFKPKDVEKMMQ